MQKKILIQTTILLLGINLSIKGQNLVPNPSFENYLTCPTTFDQISIYTGNWFSNPAYTPDYYNSCEPNSNLAGSLYPGVPNNLFGFQYASTGNAYAGFVAYDYNVSESREFISTQLNSALIIGTKYFVTFKVNLAFELNTGVSNACNNLGMHFTVDNLQSSFPIQPNIPQVNTTNIVNDTLGWTTISGSFIASDTSKYITIGNFFNDSLTQVQALNQPGVGGVYYYIDDVCVSSDSLTCYSLNVGQNQKTKFKKVDVYPNPTTGLVLVDLHLSSIKTGCNISVKNTLGEEVFKSTNLMQNLYIDTENWGAKGLYFMDILDDNQNRISINRIIVQ